MPWIISPPYVRYIRMGISYTNLVGCRDGLVRYKELVALGSGSCCFSGKVNR